MLTAETTDKTETKRVRYLVLSGVEGKLRRARPTEEVLAVWTFGLGMVEASRLKVDDYLASDLSVQGDD